jgi:hypothetical protein
MAVPDPNARKPRLLKEFDKAVARVKPVFVSHYGAERTHILLAEARREYDALIPQLPDLGGRLPFTQFIISTAWFLAMYRVLQREGSPLAEVGPLIYEVSAAYLKAYPGFAGRFFGYMTFSPWYIRRLKQRAVESQQRRYPGDYVYRYIEGDGEIFDYGVDYTECGTCKFLTAQGAPELAPYVCTADKLYSEMLGWGLRRTMTLAEGADHCDFRFKRGGPTLVSMPPGLE